QTCALPIWLQRPRINGFSPEKSMRLMDMSQGQITESCRRQPSRVDGEMLPVSSMGKQHMESVFLLRRPAVVQILPDHLTVIAHPIDKGIQFRNPHTGPRLVFKKGYVRLPCKSPVKRILLYIIMVPRHQEHPGFRYGGKEIIHFFQFSQEGLPVKKISAYK